jgi:hypothetical protein
MKFAIDVTKNTMDIQNRICFSVLNKITIAYF